MAITIKDIHEKEFTKQVRGYSIDEVDDFLDELADQMEAMIDKRVVAMRLYDQEHGTQYLETAIMSVSHPGSPAEAANAGPIFCTGMDGRWVYAS